MAIRGNTVGDVIDALSAFPRTMEVTNMEGDPVFEITKDEFTDYSDSEDGVNKEAVMIEFEES